MVRYCLSTFKTLQDHGGNEAYRELLNNGFYQVLSAETGTKHGLKCVHLVFDEIHAQPNRKLYDVLTKGSMMPRTAVVLYHHG